jgi:hypothetical protein
MMAWMLLVVGGVETERPIWQGPCRPATLQRPDEPTAGKPDGS